MQRICCTDHISALTASCSCCAHSCHARSHLIEHNSRETPDNETHVNLHLLVQPIAQHQRVRHAEAVRLHRVVGAIIHGAHLTCGCVADCDGQITKAAGLKTVTVEGTQITIVVLHRLALLTVIEVGDPVLPCHGCLMSPPPTPPWLTPLPLTLPLLPRAAVALTAAVSRLLAARVPEHGCACCGLGCNPAAREQVAVVSGGADGAWGSLWPTKLHQ